MSMIPAMKDMRRTNEEKEELLKDISPYSISSQPDYPYGLCISLTDVELKKLGLDNLELKPGDILHFHALAKVTSYSENASEGQEPTCRAELVITHMSAESEDEENDEDEDRESRTSVSKKALSKLYD